jgi:hypothetical protein
MSSAVAAGTSCRGDSGEGGKDGPRERLGRVAAESWGEGEGMTAAEEEAGAASWAAEEDAGMGGRAAA